MSLVLPALYSSLVLVPWPNTEKLYQELDLEENYAPVIQMRSRTLFVSSRGGIGAPIASYFIRNFMAKMQSRIRLVCGLFR